jgi:hypothetical protein
MIGNRAQRQHRQLKNMGNNNKLTASSAGLTNLAYFAEFRWNLADWAGLNLKCVEILFINSKKSEKYVKN